MKLPRWFKRSLLALVFLSALLALVVAYAWQRSLRPWDVPTPGITADRSEAGVARGAAIFRGTCEACHVAPGGARAAGAAMLEAPDWLGRLHSANITADPVAGIGAVSDPVLARTIRYGVDRARRWIPMPAYAMSDADLAAVIGFMRSGDPLFEADAHPAPPSQTTALGRVALLLGGVFDPPAHAAAIEAPPRAPEVEYGRYLAEAVYQCGDCHTPGMGADKLRGPQAYAGGVELRNAAGKIVLSANLTRDEDAGIGRWNRGQFAVAVQSGVRPDGLTLDATMPRYRGIDAIEVDALFAYLRSLPARSEPVVGRKPALPAPNASVSSATAAR